MKIDFLFLYGGLHRDCRFFCFYTNLYLINELIGGKRISLMLWYYESMLGF